MTWNYRLLDRSHKNGGEPWVEIVEVYYDENNKPIGFSEPSINAETKEETISNLQTIINDISKQNVLKVSDFNMTIDNDKN
jgi:hypothetical protein